MSRDVYHYQMICFCLREESYLFSKGKETEGMGKRLK